MLLRRQATLLLLALVASYACTGESYPVVDLDQVDAAVAAPTLDARPLLRVAVATMVSPLSAHEHYSQLVEYLGDKVGRKVRFLLRKSYAEVNDLLLNGRIDLAFLCTGGFLDLQRRSPEVSPLCVPRVGGKLTYRSYIIVSAGSPWQEFSQLRGKSFAFTDPLSQTGCLWPTHLARRAGAEPREFFGRLTFSGSHDRSIRAVALGVVDAAAVDSLVFGAMALSQPEITDRVRILNRSPEFGMPPVVASPRLDAPLRQQLRQVMLHLHEDSRGRSLLGLTGIERFVPAPADLYDSARRVFKELEARR